MSLVFTLKSLAQQRNSANSILPVNYNLKFLQFHSICMNEIKYMLTGELVSFRAAVR